MRPRASATEWRRRVERWKESGLSAEQFAAETGLSAPTLRVWASKLKRAVGASAGAPAASSAFVEILPTVASIDARFEFELGNGRRVRVPASFDPQTLERLLGLLDRA